MLLFFLLYSRKDLRDRFVRLAARARIPIAAQAIETAGATVGHYLLLFSLINLAYGIATGTVAWYARAAERAAVGPGRVPVAVHPVRRRDQLGDSAGAGRLCVVSRMGQGARDIRHLRPARSGCGADLPSRSSSATGSTSRRSRCWYPRCTGRGCGESRGCCFRRRSPHASRWRATTFRRSDFSRSFSARTACSTTTTTSTACCSSSIRKERDRSR